MSLPSGSCITFEEDADDFASVEERLVVLSINRL